MKTELDTPQGVAFTDLERQIIEGIASRKSPTQLSVEIGIPKNAILNLVRRPEVAEFIQEIIEARNLMMKMQLPDLLMGIIEDKVAQNAEDDERRLADLTRKDVVDVARQLNDMLKTTGSTKEDGNDDVMTKLYQQINIIQNGDK
jgi:hypothetical protein